MRKLVIMNQFGDFIQVRTTAQFWAMVTPISNEHRDFIKQMQFYRELRRGNTYDRSYYKR